MWSRWGLSKNKDGLSIRRYKSVAGKIKWERYPKEKYRNLNEQDVEALVRRLNASEIANEISAKKRFIYDHAYVNKKNLERFEEILIRKSKDHKWPRSVMNYLHNYVFEYFVKDQRLADPKLWSQFDDRWALWLKNKTPISKTKHKKTRLSGSSLKQIVNSANQYLAFLEDKIYVGESIRRLKPFVRGELDKMESDSGLRFKYISDLDWEKICAAIDNHAPIIKPLVILCYSFGLRASESLALSLSNIRNNYLLIDGQLTRLGSVSRPKNYKSRKVPYWCISPYLTYETITKIKPMHPHTFVRLFSDVMKKSGLDFKTHDLRRTFITKALDSGKIPFEVKEAVGHSEFSTTMIYYQRDKAKTEDDIFTP